MNALDTQTRIAVVGAGAMGSGIAQVAAQAGHEVFLFDQSAEAVDKGRAGIAKQLQRRVDKGKLDQATADAVVARVLPANQLSKLATAGLVIEAIVENLEIKQKVFAELEDICGEQVILATNTSSLSVTALGSALKRPERLVGMHFFNPAPVMALVEVILGLATDKNLAEQIHATAAAWGKKPVFASSTPGFIVNRVARPFYAESLRLMQEGAGDPATLDALLREAGNFRMGPFELTDLIGQDVNYAVTSSVFAAYYGDFRFQPSLIQKSLVDAGRLGRKSGQGFYAYDEKAERPQASTTASYSSDEKQLVVEGNPGVLSGLVARAAEAGLEIVERDGCGLLRFGRATLALTDGRMATERSVTQGLKDLVLVDLAFDYRQASRLAIAVGEHTDPAATEDALALLQQLGIQVTQISDLPGLVVMRTLAMLANEGADAVLQGVASPADVDLAMQAGLNYPQGPLAWSDRLGDGVVHQVLTHLQASYCEDRYRPSLLLRRNAFAHQGFFQEAAS
ncbi:3-hydroxyacyl-CoA dehydrogenase PaaH [Marinospirillum perlucidum]|uniref:3-hydroxyacyl-CoA dehydrogenase PaaH n=1 Tax=Marinospirillum perlucidum TaxID=1982602 RepID=UPI000DF154E9|nr:3-hydroxyacyl-CoA dehydrogenase PaaH [Marinospirillum perlucidum]